MGVLKHKKPLSLIVVVTVYKENHHQINFLRSPLENLYKALTSTEPPRLKFKTVSLVRPPKITTPSPISKLSSIKPTCIDSLEKLQKTWTPWWKNMKMIWSDHDEISLFKTSQELLQAVSSLVWKIAENKALMILSWWEVQTKASLLNKMTMAHNLWVKFQLTVTKFKLSTRIPS